MSTLSEQDFNQVFLDVRNSYRLLYLYQRRVMDVIKFIGDQLSLRYAGGWSWFSDSSPKDGKGSLNHWAWDWLNMYMYEFNFNDLKVDSNVIKFSLVVISDTGYFDADCEDPKNIGSFAPAETSSTQLLFLAGKNAWWPDFEDFDQNQTYRTNAEPLIRKTETGALIAISFDLINFIDAERSVKAIKEFVDFCQSNGIPEFGQLKIKSVQ
jgi:hypothetical protein